MNSKPIAIQHNEDPQVATLKHTDIKPDGLQPAINRMPLARDILAGMKKADSPIDFIRKNLAPPENTVDPTKLIKEQEEKRAIADKLVTSPEPVKVDTTTTEEAKPSEDASIQYDIELKEPDVVDASNKIPKSDGQAPVDIDPLEAELDAANQVPAAENFKKLRIKAKETLKTLAQVQEEKARIEAELNKYKTGEVVPEILQEKENRIAQLSHYEKLHNLKMSPDYQEAFVKPLNKLQTRLSEFAKDYNIPPEQLNKALNITNQADLNRFLSDHFDEIGGLEVKQLLNEVKTIQTKAHDAEKEPAKALAELQEEHTRISQIRNAERKNGIAAKSKEGWVKSLFKIREEGKAQELIMKDTDPEFNDKVVKPIMTAAATEYGKIITLLAENGLENLSEELSFALARMVQLAHASAISIDSREAAIKHAKTLEQNTARTNGFIRPGIGSGRANSPEGGTPKVHATPQEAAKSLVQSMLSGRT